LRVGVVAARVAEISRDRTGGPLRRLIRHRLHPVINHAVAHCSSGWRGSPPAG